MIKVVFFASIREELGCTSLELPWTDALADLEGLLRQLYERDEGQWRRVLEKENVVCAVNQVAVTDNAKICDGDEVAFFPPVTGG